MQIDSAFTAGNVIAELAEDVWHKRTLLIANDDSLYLAYRLSVSDYDSDTDENFYIHYVVTRDRWYATISTDLPFMTDLDSLIFRDNHEEWDWRMESYRHYAFSDLLSRAVRNYVEKIQNNMSRPGNPYLWDTFPLEQFRKES